MGYRVITNESLTPNIWDEEWELGSINSSGQNETSQDRIRSKNYNECLPNTELYFKAPNNLYVVLYDEDKNFIERVFNTKNTTLTTSLNARYFRFFVLSTTTYNHDITINLSNPSINGNYYPFRRKYYKVVDGIDGFDYDNFTPVEYLESTGTEYIDTEVIGNQNTKVKIGFEYTSFNIDNQLFGNFVSNSAYITINCTNIETRYSRFGNKYKVNVFGNLIENTKYNIDVSNNGYYIDGNLKWIPNSDNFETSGNLYIFKALNSNANSNVKISYAEIYESNSLVRNFIPAIRKSDNKPCMYDTISHQAFYNRGTGEFLYGKIINYERSFN